MSLECAGDGAPCVECGEFDFLPHACPYCHGVFCAAHASCHHVPGTHGDETSALLCSPPAVLPELGTFESEADNIRSGAYPTQLRCVVCQGFPCALTPCPQCGEPFCAAHRFHGHEDAALQARLRSRANQVHATVSPELSDTSSARSINSCCAPFTSTHPLTLAPVGYRSQRMDLLALVVQLSAPLNASVTPAASNAEGALGTCDTSASKSLESSILAVPLAAEDIGVCSLVVATEMSVGQLRDRLEAALCTPQESGTRFSEEFSLPANTSFFTIVPTVEVVGETSGTPRRSEFGNVPPSLHTFTGRTPTLSLISLPVNAIVRKVPIANAAVVLVVIPANISVGESPLASTLCNALTTYLYGAGIATHRDDRVRALATRLYLQHQQLWRRKTATPTAMTAGSGPGLRVERTESQSSGTPTNSTNAADKPGAGSVAEQEKSTSAAPASTTVTTAVWPFRHASPLNSFAFFNSKLNPCGANSIRPRTAPRVIVALFVADVTLPCAVKPMCIALGKDWPMTRIVDRLREEVIEQQLTSAHRATAGRLLKTFSLYRLREVGGGNGGMVEALWKDAATAAAPSAAPLQNADVLVLCPLESPGVLAALHEEVLRLHNLTGKEKCALKTDRIKLCSVM